MPEVLMAGHLVTRGLLVPRSHLRASIHRVDPENTAARRSVTIRRRVYFADGPNAIWHIDGNHKLIRWRFVVHGGIDGYSRTVVFLRCSTNNQASTVLASFMEATEIHGLPYRVRSDFGGENMEVWRYVIEQHRNDSAVITGSSTHNERIERLWRDVFRSVSSLFYDVFRMLEDEDNLNCLNEIDMFCLHFVFQPRINSALNAFMESWNNHSLSTVGNLTPNQIFIQGALERNRFPHYPLTSQQQVRVLQLPQYSNPVEVPRTKFRACDRLKHTLSNIDPLQHCDEFGRTVYCHVSNITGQHLLHCNSCYEE